MTEHSIGNDNNARAHSLGAKTVTRSTEKHIPVKVNVCILGARTAKRAQKFCAGLYRKIIFSLNNQSAQTSVILAFFKSLFSGFISFNVQLQNPNIKKENVGSDQEVTGSVPVWCGAAGGQIPIRTGPLPHADSCRNAAHCAAQEKEIFDLATRRRRDGKKTPQIYMERWRDFLVCLFSASLAWLWFHLKAQPGGFSHNFRL